MPWTYTFTPAVWPSLSTGLFLLALAAYSWGRRAVPGALVFAAGSLLAAVVMIFSVLQIAAVEVPARVFWASMHYIWLLPAVTAFTCFGLEYTWPGRWLNSRSLALITAVMLLFVGLALTNHLHGFLWHDYQYDGEVRFIYAPGAWLLLAYAQGLGLLNLAVFGWLFYHSPPHRWPAVFMITGQVVARLLFLLVLFDVIPRGPQADLLPVIFLVIMYAVALFGFRIFDPNHLARQQVIAQMQAGMLVVDPRGQVVNLNPAAARILGLPARRARGQQVSALLAGCSAERLAQPGQFEAQLRLNGGPDPRTFSLEISGLKDWRGLEAGRLIMLRDVSERKAAQARIVEQQRSLAMLQERDQLARGMQQSLGQELDRIRQHGQAALRFIEQGELDAAGEQVDQVVAVAREADIDIRESILGLRTALLGQGLFPALAQYLAYCQKTYGIRAELDLPEGFPPGAFEPLVEVQLLRSLQEALTSIRKQTPAGCVRISFTLEGGCAQVHLQSDGPGAPGELPQEPPGLRLVRERLEGVGGSLQAAAVPGQGLALVVRVPVSRAELNRS